MLPFNRIVAVVMILLLIVAFVLVALLQGSTEQVESFAEARSLCASLGTSSCNSIKNIPTIWSINRVVVGNESRTCSDIMGCDTCESCGFS